MAINVKKLIQSVSKKNKLTKIYSGNVNFNSLYSQNNTSSLKNAPIARQRQWQNMSYSQKIAARMIHPDYDGDKTPDFWDCRPRNKYRQDSPGMNALENHTLDKTMNKDDRIDYTSEVDRSLSYDENKRLLQEKQLPSKENTEAYYEKQAAQAGRAYAVDNEILWNKQEERDPNRSKAEKIAEQYRLDNASERTYDEQGMNNFLNLNREKIKKVGALETYEDNSGIKDYGKGSVDVFSNSESIKKKKNYNPEDPKGFQDYFAPESELKMKKGAGEQEIRKTSFWSKTKDAIKRQHEKAKENGGYTEKAHQFLVGKDQKVEVYDSKGNVSYRTEKRGGVVGLGRDLGSGVGQLSNLSSVAREDSSNKIHAALGYGGAGFSRDNPFFGSQSRGGSNISMYTGTGTGMGIFDTLGLPRPKSQSQGSERKKYAYDTRGRRYVIGGEGNEATPYQKPTAKKSTAGKKKVFVKGYYTYR